MGEPGGQPVHPHRARRGTAAKGPRRLLR